MNKDKKFLLPLLVLCLVFCVAILAACNGNTETVVPGKDAAGEDNNLPEEETVFYTVTVDDSINVSSTKYKKGDSVTVTAPEVKNKNFSAWYCEGEKITTEKTYTFSVEKDASLRAVFSDEYTVYLDAREGKVELNKVTVSDNADYLLPTAAREHYYFKGWKWDNRLVTDEKGKSLAPFDFGRDVTLTAEYEEKPRYKVSVNNGETGFVEEIRYKDERVELTRKDLSADGKKLVGWYKIAKDGTETLVTKEETFSFTVSENVKYEARYAVSYRIIVFTASGVDVKDYADGETVTVTFGKLPEGKVFVKWVDANDETVTLSTEKTFTFTATKSMTIKAVLKDAD